MVANSLGTCVYCAARDLTGRERPEHIIPAALGATLVAQTVCDDCNAWVGRDIEQPFMRDDLLRIARATANQSDPRRRDRATRSPLLEGVTTEGDRIRIDPESREAVLGSRIVDQGDGRYQIRVGSEAERDRLVQRVRERFGPIEIDSEERGQLQPTYQGSLAIDLGLWRREGAKIALAAASLVYPTTWRTSGGARQLRDWLNGSDASGAGVAPPLPVGPAPAPLARGDEHLIFFIPTEAGTTIGVVLFGSLFFAIPVDGGSFAPPTRAWRLEWRTGRKRATTFDDLTVDLAERVAEGNR